MTHVVGYQWTKPQFWSRDITSHPIFDDMGFEVRWYVEIISHDLKQKCPIHLTLHDQMSDINIQKRGFGRGA